MARILVAMFVALALMAGPGVAQDMARVITVTGEGRIEAVPDMATIRLGVMSEGRTAREAIDANSRAMAGVLGRIEAAVVAARDVQTQGFSVNPRWENRQNERPRIAGFVASNQVMVRVRDLDGLGELLDAVTRDGANSFDGLSFGLQDPAPAQDAARRAAVAEAQRKATLYAEAAGVTLGPLMSIDEGGAAPRPVPMARAEMSMAMDGVPVAAGEVGVSAFVRLIYAIAE
ncbi:MAG: SIMPL domain-containing protein [Pseudomonadota bacterium]